ncbi:Gfo/Idh/MocA family oxidoreductase [Streptomyces sp. LP11]|uniref:Gfo/Idh/MocA family oxidoreductase n=1 Tax=Streptomyces pyxinicus TaxID=2970331 RepID=A0ABT2B5Z5_9ACTN|nr:Gfo/Idh/MocA family oxidoreductase [Streptomyces sp. LP11]MCS0603781.1 Gfo/Idh/MocA family oxidoreductase [Streptomyces sp. LP11]
MGSDHVRRLDRVVGGARVAAVADPDAERAREAAAGIPGVRVHTDPVAALDAPGVEAVLIASPGPAHEEALLACFERGLPVLCEKPTVPDSAGAPRVVEAEARLGRRPARIGFMRRYDAGFLRLKGLLDEGRLGRPLMPHCVHRNVSSPAHFTSAMLVNSSVSHEIDAARRLLGQEVRCEGEVPGDYLVRFADAYDREVRAWVGATRRGEVTGPDVWDGYAASAVAEAGVRSLETGGRVVVDLAPRPPLFTPRRTGR